MTHERDLERLLDTWLADGPLVVADRVIDDVAVRIVRQPQRPAWRLRPWRFSTMSTRLRLAVGVAALLVAALAGGVVFLGAGDRSPAPTPTPPPSAVPSAAALLVANGLPAGRYVASLTTGTLTFTLPAGWSSADVSAWDFTLHRDAGPNDDTVKVFTDMRRASKNAACPEVPELGVGVTNELLAQDLGADPDLEVDASGGQISSAPDLSGQIVDIRLSPSATRTCPFSDGKPTVPLIVDTIPGDGAFWGIGPNERIGLVILDALRGHNIVVAVDSADGTSFERS